MNVLEENVERGIELLNEQIPGWEDKIDLSKLDLNECSVCVLGQLFGSFDPGRVLGTFRPEETFTDNLVGYHGFTYDKRVDPKDDDQQFVELTEIWKRRIEMLKNED